MSLQGSPCICKKTKASFLLIPKTTLIRTYMDMTHQGRPKPIGNMYIQL